MAFQQLFGDVLLSSAGEKATGEALEGKTAIGIYFSAHWCPPCRNFTPKLAEMYTTSFQGKGMEIVFVSSDKDEEAFAEYFKEMPWLALPYKERDLKDKLSKQFQVKGIPSLVILDSKGDTITLEGRAAVSGDPLGEHYPWVPLTPEERAAQVLEALGADIVSKSKGKPIGIYFSAHWCPPCRAFTPKLIEYYQAGLKDKMEIIFVSSDKDEASFNAYFADMPWHALPYEKRDAKDALSRLFGVRGIPTFVVINSDGTNITADGRSWVMSDPAGEKFPEGWSKPPERPVGLKRKPDLQLGLKRKPDCHVQ